MVNKMSHIPIPWPRRMQQLRQQFMPIIMFVFCGVASLWMLNNQRIQHTMLIGEVHVMQMMVFSPIDGVVVESLTNPLAKVEAGNVIATLDNGLIRASLATMRAESDRLRAELIAAEELQLQVSNEQSRDAAIEARRLAIVIENLQIDILDRKAQIALDQIQLDHAKQVYKSLEQLVADGFASRLDYIEAAAMRDQFAMSIKDNTTAIEELTVQSEAAIGVLKQYNESELVQLEKILEPIRQAIIVQEGIIEELQVQVEALVVRAPISGRLTQIKDQPAMCQPGQNVLAGDHLFTIAGDERDTIIAYVPESSVIRVTEGMEVEVYRRSDGKMFVSSIVEVGPRVSAMPMHLLRQPDRLQWGLPVSIAVLPGVELLPGELVDVKLIAETSDDAS